MHEVCYICRNLSEPTLPEHCSVGSRGNSPGGGVEMSRGIQDNFVVLCHELDVGRIAPILRQEKMLTADEYELLTSHMTSTRVKREKLLMLLPRKGRDHFLKFSECLVWSGQEELARKIGVDVSSIRPRPDNSASPWLLDTRPCFMPSTLSPAVPAPVPPQPVNQGEMFAFFQGLLTQGKLGVPVGRICPSLESLP